MSFILCKLLVAHDYRMVSHTKRQVWGCSELRSCWQQQRLPFLQNNTVFPFFFFFLFLGMTMAATPPTSTPNSTSSTSSSSSKDVTRRMICGGLAGMIAKVRTYLCTKKEVRYLDVEVDVSSKWDDISNKVPIAASDWPYIRGLLACLLVCQSLVGAL